MLKRLGKLRMAAIGGLCLLGTAASAEAPAVPVLLVTDVETDPARFGWLSEEARTALTSLIAQHKAGQLLAYVFVGAPGGNFWSARSAQKEGDFYSMEDLTRMALESCEYVHGASCFVISINGTDATDAAGGLVRQPELLPGQPATFDVDRVPFARTQERSLMRTYIVENKPRAFVVTPLAGWSWRAGNNIFEAIAGALVDCQKNFPNQDCILYAVNNKVVYP